MKAILQKRKYIAKSKAINIVTSCLDATATATNSIGDNLGTVQIASGATGNIPIADTRINKSDGTQIALTPSTVAYNVADSTITVQYQNGTLISETDVKATEDATINVPNPLTLTEQMDASTTAQIKTALIASGEDTNIQTSLLGDYGAGFLAGKQFASLNSGVTGIRVFNNTIFACNGTANNMFRINATTNATQGTTSGFSRAFKLSHKSDGGYAVTNFTGNSVRIMNVSNIQVASFAVIASPSAIEWNIAEDLVYVAPFSGTGTITKYNLTGVSQGTVTGFQTNIVAIIKVGVEYWVLSTDNAANQSIRKMLFSNDSQTGIIALDAAVVMGVVRDMVVTSDRIYIANDTNMVREYDHAGTLLRSDYIGVPNTFGMCLNPNRRKNLLVTVPLTTGIIINIIHP